MAYSLPLSFVFEKNTSPSLVRAEDYMPQVREIFANAYLGKDAKSVELMFDED